MQQKKVFNLLGLARRAAKLALGATAVQQALHRQKVRLLIFASDAAANLKKKVMADAKNCPVCTYSTKAGLGSYFGREELAVIAVLDDGFAHGILAAIEQESTTETDPGNDRNGR